MGLLSVLRRKAGSTLLIEMGFIMVEYIYVVLHTDKDRFCSKFSLVDRQ